MSAKLARPWVTLVLLSAQTVEMSVSTKGELDELLTKEVEKVVIVKFGAGWCAPCQKIAPADAEVLQEFDEHVVSVAAGHDDAEELFDHHEVTGMPTFVLFKHSKMEMRLSPLRSQHVPFHSKTYSVVAPTVLSS